MEGIGWGAIKEISHANTDILCNTVHLNDVDNNNIFGKHYPVHITYAPIRLEGPSWGVMYLEGGGGHLTSIVYGSVVDTLRELKDSTS